jgi:mono/diheme cytochrome c family protein
MKKVTALIALVGVVLIGCGSSSGKIAFSSIGSQGDAKHGEQLFTSVINQAPACSTCHTLDESQMVGPGLGKIKELAGTRVQGESAREYLFHSIIEPARYIVPGYSNLMYPSYNQVLSAQDITDLIEYLLSR